MIFLDMKLPGINDLDEGVGNAAFGKITHLDVYNGFEKVDTFHLRQFFVPIGNTGDDAFGVGSVEFGDRDIMPGDDTGS